MLINKYDFIDFSSKIKRNKLIRIFMFLPVTVYRRIVKISFRFSKDYEFIKSLKDAHKGERCILIGNGPSLNENDLELLKNEFTFASNRIYTIFERTSWRPNIYMCGDVTQMQSSSIEIPEMKGTIKLLRNNCKRYPKQFEDSFHYFIHDGSFALDKEKLFQSRVSEDVASSFSISQSITCLMFELAFYMGFNEVYLIGVDHRFPIEIDMNGNTIERKVDQHFKGEVLAKKTKQNFCYKEALTKSYEVIAEYAKKNSIKIYDATRNGELNVFEKIDFSEVNWKCK